MTEWIKWEGGEECPVSPGTPLELKFRDGEVYTTSSPEQNYWEHGGDPCDIIAYRRSDAAPKAKDTQVDEVLEERAARYGKFIDQAKIACELKIIMFDASKNNRYGFDHDMTEALGMIAHKIARIINGDPKYADSWLDIAGYAKLVADRLNGIER